MSLYPRAEEEAVAVVGDRVLRIAAVDGIPCKERMIAEVLTTGKTGATASAGIGEPGDADAVSRA